MSQVKEVALRRAAAARESNGTVSAPRPLSLSPVQRRLWQLDQAGVSGAAHHLFRALRLTGPLDTAALGEGLNQVLQRHDSLRASFPGLEKRGPLHLVAPSLQLDLPLTDLEALAPEGRGAESQRLAVQETCQSFDLRSGPLVRARLVRLGQLDHLLLLTVHRIVADEDSLGIVLQELADHYNALVQGQPAPDLGPAASYPLFGTQQENWLQSEAGAAELNYWKGRLAGAPPALELPTDRPRLAQQGHRGARLLLHLPEALAQALELLSRDEEVNLSVTLLAAFKALLHRYTQQEDLLVGAPVPGRLRPKTEGMVGPLANLLALRTVVSGSLTFRELLAHVGKVVEEAHAHQEVPFARLIEELAPQRDPSRAPLVQIAFRLHEGESTSLPSFTGLASSPWEPELVGLEHDLSVSAVPDQGGVTITFEHDTDLFDLATIDRFAGHYRTLLEGVAADPAQRLSSLPLLTEPEKHQILVTWNNTRRDVPEGCTLAQLFEAQAARTPDSIALVFEGQQLTYQELNQRANRLAQQLRDLNVGPEVLVGICAERSVEMVVGLLATLKAGGAYVPLDPAYPQDRVAYMLSDSGIAVLLTQWSLAGQLPPTDVRTLYLDDEAGSPTALDNLALSAKPDNLAYVIYTSGSTGRPKGVQVLQRAVVNFLRSMAREPGLTERDTLLAVTTLSFDIAGLELWLPLTVGAKLILLPREITTDGNRLLERLSSCGATVMQATPATWRLLLEAGWSGTPGLKILCGGEALSPELVPKLLARGASVWNMYGPTETTIWSTLQRVDERAGSVPIGHPIDNTQVYVLDTGRQLVPAGAVGELFIGGIGLARGYLHRPDLTAEKFVPDPFGGEGARMYRTGDLARWLPTGELECLGRVDHQVKVRGFRIELGEIEAVLLQHPTVGKAVVVAREDAPGQRRLVGYVVAAPGEEPASGDLRRFLKERLPEYMVPMALVVLEALPLTPNGKVDRKALPAPTVERSEQERPYVAPRDPLELELSQIWEQSLGMKPIGVQDNFFDLGVDSLTAAGLFGRLQKRFGADLPIGALFRAPTIEQLAGLLRRPETRGAWTSLVPMQPRGSRAPLYCLHGGAGTILMYHDLARHLGADQPVYGLQARGLYGKAPPLSRIEDMAAHYIREIRSVQPHGPYHLIAFCSFGISIAYEMAHQLVGMGEKVGLLCGLNAPVPLYLERLREQLKEPPPDLQARVSRLKQRVSVPGLKGKALSLARTVTGAIAWRWQRLRVRCRRLQYRYYLVMKRPVPDGLRRKFFAVIHFDIESRYQPRRYPGRLVLFHAKGLYPDQDLGWTGLAETLEIHEMAGNHRHHRDLLAEPFVGPLARELTACLERASAE